MDISCPVCFMPYTVSGENIPYIVRECGHTFCQACLIHLIDDAPHVSVPGSVNAVSLSCPLKCEQKTLVKNGIQSLMRNWTLIQLINAAQEEEKKKLKTTAAAAQGGAAASAPPPGSAPPAPAAHGKVDAHDHDHDYDHDHLEHEHELDHPAHHRVMRPVAGVLPNGLYFIELDSAAHPGHVLDVDGNSTDALTWLIHYRRHGGDNQKFKVERVQGARHIRRALVGLPMFKITAQHSGLVLDIDCGSKDDDVHVIQYPWGDKKLNQLFVLGQHDGTDACEIIAAHSGKALSFAADLDTEDGHWGWIMQRARRPDGEGQRFRFIAAEE